MPLALIASAYFTDLFSLLTVFLFFLTLLNFYFRHIQTRHTLLSNFGILALLRYIIESLGPELRQYLYASDTEGRPFSRVERKEVYIKAKNKEKNSSFGSLKLFDGKDIKLKHSFYPETELEEFSLTFGEKSKNPYTLKKPLMIAAMSYGALGKRAVKALSRGAKKAGILLNSGEGGYPKYHLEEECDLIFQMGTGKFGVRNEEGKLDKNKLEKLSQEKYVKMIEIKFSQGAKPGKGGILPKEKITDEIATLRNIPKDKDAISPPRHLECKDAPSTLKFIKQIQEISSLPVGLKFCLGSEKELFDLLSLMKKEKLFF